jgi:hypothetical protein
MKILHLPLKGEYFDAIRDGSKTHEFRLAEKWEKRIAGKDFDEIHLTRGYPPKSDESRRLRRIWRGFERRTITHPHFGPDPVEVLAIDVSLPARR